MMDSIVTYEIIDNTDLSIGNPPAEILTRANVSELQHLSNSLESAFDLPESFYSDGKLVLSGGREVSFHRCVVAGRSPFFRRLLATAEKSSDSTPVKLELKEIAKDYEVGFDSVVAVLAYVYSGRVRPPPKGVSACADENCCHVACRPAVDFMVEVLYLTFVFEIPELVTLFERYFLNVVDKVVIEDTLVILKVANICGRACKRLLDRCREIIVKSDVDFVTLNKSLPHLIVKEIIYIRKELGLESPEVDKHVLKILSALDSNDLELVKLLLTESYTNLDDACALHFAVAYCDVKTATELINMELADVNRRNARGYTVLHVAAMRKDPDLILSLLTIGANASETSSEGRTALLIAKQVTMAAEYNYVPERCKPALKGRLCIDLLEKADKHNPFLGDVSPSLAEAADELAADESYLKAARETTQETDCILIFSCNDNLDVDETSFIEAISKELHKREVTPLTYNLLGRENLDEKMLHRSSVAIMILSYSYASSRQSLDHLVAIMEHWKATGLVIIPIYFKVTLSDICGLKGRFEAAFLHLQSSLQEDRVQKWKAAVTEIVFIGGLEWTKGTQLMLAEDAVRNASLRLYLRNSKNLHGIFSLLHNSQSTNVEIMGIWGMAGIGKTSIAREVSEILAPHYDLCYFLQDFHLMCQSKGLAQLRDDFFSKVFGEEKLSIGACDTKLSFMKDMFRNKTILVVLDDVNTARDAEAVVGGFGWFSNGHTIILTSRKKQVLVQCKVKELYEIQKLCESECFRLCKQYLNGKNEVISELVSCSSGIPLALKVFVSSVSKQHIKNMKEHLQILRKNPPIQMQEAFQRSFDGLDENEKNIFLDLACFFRGENKDHVVQLLDACEFFTSLGICDLIDESLISLLDNKIEMPIPFQDIGRFVVHEEDVDPCERSRLWDCNDIADVFSKNSGTDAIEGIFLDTSDVTCVLSPTVFDKMYKLRLLKFHSSISGNQCMVCLPQGLYTLPDELRLLHWEDYPLEMLPQNFIPENLVEINMPHSNMEKLWEGKKNLQKLKIIRLSHSTKLTDIQMLSEALNLEHIDLEGCTSLVDVSTSIPRYGKLVSLNMKDCSHLRSLPIMVDLTSLKLLNLSGCSKLEEIQDFAPNLKELYLAGTAIRELPLSIENLAELVKLDLENCRTLQQLPLGIRNSRSIVQLKLSGCASLRSLPKLKAEPFSE